MEGPFPRAYLHPVEGDRYKDRCISASNRVEGHGSILYGEISSQKYNVGAGEMAQSVKCLQQKYEDLS